MHEAKIVYDDTMDLREAVELLARVLPENTFRMEHEEGDVGIHLAKYKGKYTIMIDVAEEGTKLTITKAAK